MINFADWEYLAVGLSEHPIFTASTGADPYRDDTDQQRLREE